MIDSRLTKLAKLLICHSTELKKGDRGLIIIYGIEAMALAKEIYRQGIKLGAHLDYQFQDNEFSRIFLENADDAQITDLPNWSLKKAESYDVMFQLLAERSHHELALIDQKKMALRHWKNGRILFFLLAC